MNQQTIKTVFTDLTGKARVRAEQAGDQVQQRAFVAAGAVDAIKTPARKLNAAGQKLNDLTHRYYTKLLKHQIKSFEDTVNAGSTRLKAVGDATNLRELVQTQIALFQTHRDGAIENIRTAAGIVGETGVEIGKLAKATLVDIKGGKPGARKSAAKKTGTKKTASSKKSVKKGSAKSGSGPSKAA